MKKLKTLLMKYETRKMSLEMEIEHLNDHNYKYEVQWKEFEFKLLSDSIRELKACLDREEGK